MLAAVTIQENLRAQAVLRERLQPKLDIIGAALTDLNPKEALSVLNAIAIDVLRQAAMVNDPETVMVLKETFIRIIQDAPIIYRSGAADDERREPKPGTDPN